MYKQQKKVEPQHEMYLNEIKKLEEQILDSVEPQHEMYLNLSTASALHPVVPVEPQHEMYLNKFLCMHFLTVSLIEP